MKRLFATVFLCVFLIPYGYGETIYYGDGIKYVGEVSNGLPHGQGRFTWADGETYVGDWKGGRRHGFGTQIFASGESFVGEFLDDRIWNGSSYAADGTLQGNVRQGVPEFGEGCAKRRDYIEDGKSMVDCEFADGERYVGEFRDEHKQGHGTQTYGGGSKYVGEFKDSQYHGQGTFIWSDGKSYVGEFMNGLMHGQGTYSFVSGEKHVGEWKENNLWNGTIYHPDGTVGGIVSEGKMSLK
jgi:hypothetical protein